MTEENKPQKPNWWQTLPGILTAIAAILTALTGLIAGLYEVGFFRSGTSDQQTSIETPTLLPSTAQSPSISQPDQPSDISPQVSTDIDNPIPLTSGVIEGLGIAEEVSHYYTFQGGYGYVEVTVQARNNAGVAASAIGVEILKMNGTSLAKIDMGYTSQLKIETRQFPLGQREQLLMRVDLDPATIGYRVKISGAVDFN